MKFIKKKISELSIELIDGDRGKNYPKKNEFLNKGDCVFLNAKNVTSNDFCFEEINFITKEKDKLLNNGKLKRKDIVLTTRGTVGNVAYYSEKIPFECMRINSGMIIIRCQNSINEKYIYWYMRTKQFKNQIKELQTGSAQPQLPLSIIKNMVINICNMKNQNKIVYILDKIQEKINLNTHINNNLYEIGRAYFENYLESCKEEISIKEVANEILDYHKSKEKKVKLINSSDITENNFPEFEFVDNCNLKGHFKKRFRKYDILYSQIRPRNHHFGYVLFGNTEEYIASTRLMVVRAKEEKISSSLLYYYLTSKEAIEDFTTKTETRSGTFPQGNYGDLSSFKIKYNKNQENITNVLNIVLNRIYSNQLKTKNLEKIRDVLLPKLMNGEIDLDKIEI